MKFEKSMRMQVLLIAASMLVFGAACDDAQQPSPTGMGQVDHSLASTAAGVPAASPPRIEHDHQKGRLLIKLVPPAAFGSKLEGGKAIPGTEREILAQVAARPEVEIVAQQFPDATPPKVGSMVRGPDGIVRPEPDLTRWHRVEFDESVEVAATLAAVQELPGIALAEPDYLRKPSVIPTSESDPLFDQQWHLAATRVPEAWAHLESLELPPGGNRNVIVAVIDTGVDLEHPDLAANLWTHSRDRVHGRNVVAGNDNPMDDHGHGTHVAGIIAAQADNRIGGVGVAHNVQIMAIKAAQYSGVLASSHIAQGIYYAVTNGADVINMSFGGYGRSSIEEDALAVAFGQAVLVAAAGNDGIPNDAACNPMRSGTMYPAGYNWVIGVMASTQYPGASGGHLAGFSNYDCIPRDAREYEVMAPGAAISSTVPGGQYAAWSGTSMATPVVSGIAALVRTRFPDKTTHSSRFIMGQIATTGSQEQAYTPERGLPLSFHTPDALAALTSFPQPRLTYLESWVFDPASAAPTNNGNGTIDAGETIDLAIVIRNHWGRAENVTVHIEPWAEGAVFADPFVTMITDTVNYGAVGSFASDDNNLIVDETGKITGVEHPFRFSVSSHAPNGHIIPFKITMTAFNGFDPGDETAYVTESRFYLKVTNGRVLPRIISEDMVLGPETLWLVRHPVLVAEGATVRVMPGTTILFGFNDQSIPQRPVEFPYIHVKGTLLIQGSTEDPVQLDTDPMHSVVDLPYARVFAWSAIINQGRTEVDYAVITNPQIGQIQSNDLIQARGGSLDRISHAAFDFSHPGHYNRWIIDAVKISDIQVKDIPSTAYLPVVVVAANIIRTQFNSTSWQWWYGHRGEWPYELESVTDSVFLGRMDLSLRDWIIDREFLRNAVLNNYLHPSSFDWMKVRLTEHTDYCINNQQNKNIRNNYWGTTNPDLIDVVIWDFNDDFTCPRLEYQPILEVPSEETYPFVWKVEFENEAGAPSSVFGAEAVTMTVTFNRDMDPSVAPEVSFGPAEPYTDFVVKGAWTGPRTWQGRFDVSAFTGDGYQYVRVAGAAAADDPWLITGNDKGRFRFEVMTSGSAAMNLHAAGGEGFVDLNWTQDDFELLAGFNLYRAPTPEGPFTRVNPTIVPALNRVFRDTNVNPGQPYYYHFVVVQTDMTESSPSNTASATPLDTIPPVIHHSPTASAAPGLSLSLTANVTDNVAVRGVELHFRPLGGSTYTTRPMPRTTGNTYVATIEGSFMTSPGVEYFISATDGISTVQSGRPEYPHQVVVVDRPVITSVSPGRGPASGATTVTIAGSNFKPGVSVSFGSQLASSVTVVSSTQITATTPQHFPTAADITVTNPGGQSGQLLRAFIFQSDVASLSLPPIVAGQHSVILIPIHAAAIDGLVAADLTVHFDASVIRPRGATTGTLTPGWSLSANTATSGEMRISLASSGGPVVGTGVLARLEFEVIGAPSSNTAVTLSTVSLNGGAIPFSTAAGSVEVGAVYSVSGNVGFWASGAAIPDVDLHLAAEQIHVGQPDHTGGGSSSEGSGSGGIGLLGAGARLYVGQTDETGAYSIDGVPPSAFTLEASKTGGDNGITAYDASLVLQHASGASRLSGHQATAADVDKSGTIDSMDAFYILQRAAGLIQLPFPGAGETWTFTPPSRNGLLESNRTGQDFVGILLGDTSGNYSGHEFAGMQAMGSVGIQLIESVPSSEGTVVATITMAPGTEEVLSLDLVLRYDPSLGTPVSVSKGPAADQWMMTSNLSEPGEIRISMAGAQPITADGTMVRISFDTAASAQDVNLIAERAMVNETMAANVSYALTLEHVWFAARMATGLIQPSAALYSKYDVAPLEEGVSQPDDLMDIEDVVVILRRALESASQ